MPGSIEKYMLFFVATSAAKVISSNALGWHKAVIRTTLDVARTRSGCGGFYPAVLDSGPVFVVVCSCPVLDSGQVLA
jgi:hypothetical protein